jgi:endonuclease G
MDPKAQALLDQLLERSNDPLLAEDPAPVPAVHAPALSEATREDRMASTVIYVTGSTTINVGPGSIGQPSTTAAAEQARQPSLNGGASAAIVATEKKLRFDKKYRQRQGYDEKFLDGFTIPLPGVTTERAAELLKGDARGPLILHYHHFSLAMNRKRRLQMWSAVNVDYDPDRKSTRDRKEFGTDTWIADPRIPAELQIDDDDFYAPATKIDRGHIVRREDNAWGGSELEIEYANSDTFHWTNCTPQHEAFNREQFSGLWGRFEAHITTSIDAVGHRATIFAGPVLDNQRDPSKDFGNGPVQYPLKFWKVVAAVSRRSGQPTLMAWGFLFDQSGPVDRFGIEAIDFRRFKREQRSLEKLSTLTGVTFPRGLLDADVLKGTNPNETISVDSLESIRLDHA